MDIRCRSVIEFNEALLPSRVNIIHSIVQSPDVRQLLLIERLDQVSALLERKLCNYHSVVKKGSLS